MTEQCSTYCGKVQLVKEFSSDVPSENALEGVAVQLDGVVFECKGRLSIRKLSELAAKAIDGNTAEAAEAASIYLTLLRAFGPEEYARMDAHMEEHDTPDETYLQILQYVNECVQANVERITARPTRPSSSSSAGLAGKEDLPVRSISLSKQTVTTGDPGQAAKTPKPRKPPTRRRTA
jgi:hypothetical protein